MNLRELQAEHAAWSQHNFGDVPTYYPLLGAVEELGELAHAHLKQAENIRMSEDHEAKARDAVADTIIFLMDYSTRRGWDLETLIETAWNEVKKRDWKANPITAKAEDQT